MTGMMPDSVDLRLRSDGGPYRWRQLFALLGMEGVDRLLLPPAVLSSKHGLVQSLSVAAVRDLDEVADMSLSEAPEPNRESFFAASEIVIREVLQGIEHEVGDDCARAVHEYGTLTDTAREFAWKTLLRRLLKAERSGNPGYTQHDIALTDLEYRKLLGLVKTYLSNLSREEIADQLALTASSALLPALDTEGDSFLDHLADLVGWRATNSLIHAMITTMAPSSVDQLVDWAQRRANDLGIDPRLLLLSR